jgi:putative transposase
VPLDIADQFEEYTSRVLREEFPHLRSRLSALWSKSYFAATAGAVSAAAVQRYIDTRYERPWCKEKTR